MARGKKVLKLRAQAKRFTFKFQTKSTISGAVGRYYPADDVVKTKGPASVRGTPKIRASITPGTVLILLAGRFRGKRVVFLKQLTSGLLLVSGPFGVNGVPLRRVNQRYVIATSTNVSVAGVDVSKIDDAYFAREKVAKKTGEAALFDSSVTPASRLSEAHKATQAAVDTALTANIDKVQFLKSYLQAKFSLSKGDKPHALKF